MGWSFGWNTKEELVSNIDRGHGAKYEVLDKAMAGSEYYVLMRNKENGEKFIALFLLKATRYEGRTEWGYKAMDESAGPCYYRCPERLLAQSTINDGYAPKWRESCRQARRDRGKANEAFIAGLKKGDRFMYEGREIEFLYRYNRGRRGNLEGIAGSPLDKGGTYRYAKNKIKPMEERDA